MMTNSNILIFICVFILIIFIFPRIDKIIKNNLKKTENKLNINSKKKSKPL